MAISQIITTGEPYIRSYTKHNVIPTILSSTCTGFIQDVTLSGGTPPYTIFWEGPPPAVGVFTADTLNITNLCAGVYSGTVTDSLFSAHTSFIPIETQFIPTLSASTIDSGCTTNINGFCKIKVHSFTHLQGQFTYILYQDGLPFQNYVGITGNEEYIFEGIPPGNYTLTGYDGVEIDLDYLNLYGNCSDGYFLNSDIFGSTGNVFTGLEPTDILGEWDRSIKFSESTLSFGVGIGPNFYSGFSAAIQYDSGLQSNGKIDFDNPKAWFYTGSTITRESDQSDTWYLGELALPMEEGQDVGPAGLTLFQDIGKFYYNTVINKIVYNFIPDSTSVSWVTYDPDRRYGPTGNPVASQALTGTGFYTTGVALGNTRYDYSCSGSTNDVFAWDEVSNDVFNLNGNVNLFLTNKSTCGYCNYIHEVTLGSSDTDDDNLGVVLTSFRDEMGVYGNINHTHNIMLFFNNTPTENSVNIMFNQNDRTNAFVENDRIRYCGTHATSGCTSAYSGYSSVILTRPTANTPFSVGNYAPQGTVRLRIERSGNLGELFRIQMTDLMFQATVGTPNPYNPLYEINLNLLDKTTWVGESQSAPDFATNNDLVRFLGAQSIGYAQGSQPLSRFFNISFSGTQCGTVSSVGGYGASDSEFFSLYNPDLFGIDFSENTGPDYRKSIGGGSRIGKPTVPWINPIMKGEIETIFTPSVIMLTGGTKIDAETDDYVILDPTEYDGEKLLQLSFKWTTNTTNMINGNQLPYYCIHEFNSLDNRFKTEPLYSRILSNPLVPTYSLAEDGEVVGVALEYTDKIPFIPTGSLEYLIKTHTVSKDKLNDVVTNAANPIFPPVECPEVVTHQIWLDNSNYTTDDPNNVLGNYDSNSDFVFAVLPTVYPVDLSTKYLDLGNPKACGTLIKQEEVVISISGITSGATITDFNPQSRLVVDQRYTIILNRPPTGDVVVTVNGVTMFEGEHVGDADYFVDGDAVIFPPNVLVEFDLINCIYVPGDTNQSYNVVSELVPSTVPLVTGDTIPIPNTLFHNGFYYFVEFTPQPIGLIGACVNGVVLGGNTGPSGSGDITRVTSTRIRFTNQTFPGGFQTNDTLLFFFFTQITLLGVATNKHPTVKAIVYINPATQTTLTLVVTDSEGNKVQQTSEVVTLSTNQLESTANVGATPSIRDALTIFTVDVPGPGTYYYYVESEVSYYLVNKNKARIINSDKSPTYTFIMNEEIYYLPDEEENE